MRKISLLVVLATAFAFGVCSCSYAGFGDIVGGAAKGALSKKQDDKKQEKESASSEQKTSNAKTEEAVPAYTGPKKRLAVMDMEVKITQTTTMDPTATGGMTSTTTTTVSIPPPSDFGTGLTEMLTTSLFKTGRFVLLERKALTDIFAEQALGSNAQAEPESAAKSGKLLGAQVLVRGAVTEYTYRKTSTGANASVLKGVGLARSKADAMVVLDIRLYETTTGRIIDSVKADGRAKSAATAVTIDKEDFKMSAAGFSSTPLGEATRQAMEKAVAFVIEKMECIPWEGRIAELEQDAGAPATLYINAGSDMGLKVGDKLEVLRPGKDIIDPETRVSIGRTKDKRIGACRVENVTKNLAVAVSEEGEGFQVNDIVCFTLPSTVKHEAVAEDKAN